MGTHRPPRSRFRSLLAAAKCRTTLVAVLAVLVAGGLHSPQDVRLVHSGSGHELDQEPRATISIDGVDYPNPLQAGNGKSVDNATTWENSRRPELLEAFRRHVYGESLPLPVEQRFDVTADESSGVTRKTVTIGITGPHGTGSFDLKLFVPNSGAPPRGTFLMIDHRGSVGEDPQQSSDYAPVSTITDAGYAFAAIDAEDIAPDDSGTYRSKMINLFHDPGAELPEDAGRTISAWAWGASRAMDYLETDPDIDPTRVAVIGHSRSGKASLWAGAQDTRFAAAVSNNSGSTGAKLARRGDGGVGAETVADINSSFPHWFPPTYKEYDNREEALPVDQHELLALMAPRRVVVGSAANDTNADPEGEFLSYVAAARVYELYGLGDTGLPSPNWKPPTDTDFRGPAMSYHLLSGGHGLSAQGWDLYLNGDLFAR